MIEVKATRRGLYGGQMREPGDAFTVESEAAVSKKWMVVKGTAAYDAFTRGNKEAPAAKIDGITGERLASGGIAEELAMVVAERDELRAKLAELEARVEGGGDENKAPVEPVNAPDEDDTGEADTDTDTATEAPSRPRRKRVSAPTGE